MAPTSRQTRRAGRSIVRHHEESSSSSAESTEEDSESSNLSDSEEWLPKAPRKRKRSHQMNPDATSSRHKRSKVIDLGRSSTSVWNKKRRYSTAFSSSPDPSITSPIVYERRTRQKTSGSSHSSIIAAPPKKGKAGSRTVRRAPRGRKARKSVDEKLHNVPPWQSLPYHVLLQIFVYAAQQSDQRRAHWLLGISRLCRNFTEPALTALYRTPPLLPPNRAHSLLKHLKSPMENMLFNYRNKIQQLDVEVVQTLHYSRPGEGHLDLCSLISLTPRLRHLNLYRRDDGPPYQYAAYSVYGGRWFYSDQLFSALEETGVRLRSWTWHGRMAGIDLTRSRVREIHQLPSFQGLVRLAFKYRTISFLMVKTDSPAQNPSVVFTLEDSLLPLSNLRHLTFVDCPIDGDTLASLPDYLTTLELVSCTTLTSAHLERYLHSHGSRLRELVLKHNESLNLSFLPSLAHTCPCLEVLRMDFQMYGSHLNHYDARPKFEVILLPGEIPSWPSTLHTLELVYLRNWSVETAEMFLQSLIDSAPHLPQLRRLILRAILQIGWRDRADFRDKWPPKLRSVFLRDIDELGATKSGQTTGTKTQSGGECPSNTEANGHGSSSQQRRNNQLTANQTVLPSPPLRRSLRSSRKRPLPIHADEDSGIDSDDVPLKKKLRSWKSANSVADATGPGPVRKPETRYRTRAKTELERLALSAGNDRPTLNDPIMDSRTNGLEEGMERRTGRRELLEEEEAIPEPAVAEFKQGMCDIVEVRIDNIRPTENQYREEDFLDDELSGDEDWNGDDSIPVDDRYAW